MQSTKELEMLFINQVNQSYSAVFAWLVDSIAASHTNLANQLWLWYEERFL